MKNAMSAKNNPTPPNNSIGGVKMTYEQARSFVKNNPSTIFEGWSDENERPHRFTHIDLNRWRVESLSTSDEVLLARDACLGRLKAHINECISYYRRIDGRVVELFNAIVLNPTITRTQLVEKFSSSLVDQFHPMVWE